MNDYATLGAMTTPHEMQPKANHNGLTTKTHATSRTNGIAPSGSTTAAAHTAAPTTTGPRRDLFDTTELSATDELTRKAMELPEVRHDLVARVRAEIAAGTYMTDDKINAAIDTMLIEDGDALLGTAASSTSE